MSVEIRKVTSSADRKAFVKFQFDLYAGDENWVPPITDDELKSIDPDKNPAYDFCEAEFWMAFKDGKPVGRIGAIVNNAYIEKMGEKVGRISRLEFVEEADVLRLLLGTAEDWLKDKGMTRVHGPLGFSNLDTQGMLIEGFDHLQSIASVYHKPYYLGMVEALGYEKEIDWVEFRLTVGEQAVEKASRGAKLIARRYGIEVCHFKSEDELKPYTRRIFEILNDAFQELPYTAPFSEKMIDFYASKYVKLLNPEFVKMVKLDGEMIGFVVGMPSLSHAMQKAKGKLFPFGFTHILKARKAKGVDTMDQLLTGVLQEHQSTGAGVILMAEIQNVMQQKGLKYIETTGIFETNTNAISNWKNYEHIQHKRRRCFSKSLA